MGLFDLFKKTSAHVIKDDNGIYRCPYCGIDVLPIAEKESMRAEEKEVRRQAADSSAVGQRTKKWKRQLTF